VFQPNTSDSDSLPKLVTGSEPALPLIPTYDTYRFQSSAPAFLLFPRNEAFVLGNARYPAINNRLSILIIIVLMVVFAAMAANYLNEELLAIRLSQSGKQTTANVISRRRTTGKNTTYRLTYQYQAIAPNGEPQTYITTQTVSSGTYNSHLEGSTVNIAYLPNEPWRVQLFGPDSQRSTTDFQLLFTVFMVAVMTAALYALTVPIVKDRYLVDGGQLIEGKLTERSGRVVSRGKGGSAYQVAVTYQFVSPTGETLSGTQQMDRNDLRPPKKQSPNPNLPAKGSPVAVLYKDDQHYRMM
jgi:hypothetical protein